MLYVIFLNLLDVGITFFVTSNYILESVISEDSWWNCLSVLATADTKVGFDIRVTVSVTLQACLSVEKFLQIWRLANMKTASVSTTKMNNIIIRCIVSFCLCSSIILLLQCLCLRFYSVTKRNFAEKYFTSLLNAISGSPRTPRFCHAEVNLFQTVVVWIQRSLAIVSSVTAITFNIITASLLNKNSSQQGIRTKQKASSVYFVQILLCTISLSIITFGSLIAAIIEEFLNEKTSLFLIVSLPFVTGLSRNVIYIVTSEKLRSHTREMFCKK